MNDHLERLFNLYVKKSYSSEIKKYLDSLEITDEEKEEITALATEKYTDYNVEKLIKKNKLILFFSSISAVILFFIFFYLIPKQNINNDFYYSAFGGLLISFSLYCVFVFLTSIDKERMREGHDQDFNYNLFFSFFVPIGIILGGIFYFFISWTIESGQEKILEETKILTTGIITDGRSVEKTSLRGRKSDITFLIVEFEKKGGERVQRKIDISQYEFRDFYQNEEVNLIYSSANDYNIKLLNKDSDISKYTNSQQRAFKIDDLIYLFNEKEILQKLNDIRFGWKSENENVWVNENDQSIIKKEDHNIYYLGNLEDYYTFTRELDKNYKEIKSENSESPIPFIKKSYEDNQYTFVIEPLINNNQPSKIILNIIKKDQQ